MALTVPWMNMPVISNFIKWVIKASVGGSLESGILVVNDVVIDNQIDGELKDFLLAYRAATQAPKDATPEELDAINEAQIKAARAFLTLGRDRV